MKHRRVRKAAAIAVVAAMASCAAIHPMGLAVPTPSIDPSMVPADGTPGPETPMRQSNLCAGAVAAAEPDVTRPAPAFAMLDISKAWQYSTGNGVAVAVIDTGVNPNPRLPVLPGGDYITGGDGLADCDAHGTIVASLIAAAPQGSPMPPRMPAVPASSPAAQATPTPNGHLNEQQAHAPLHVAPKDQVVGVAPHATIISIRQSSRAYEPEIRGSGDNEAHKKAGTVSTLARAIVHAANLGAKVINVSVAACISAAEALDQRSLGAAVWYAATVRDAVIVAAAGNEGEDGCVQNPMPSPGISDDPRGWGQLKTVSSPSWFADYVLSVGAVDSGGAPIGRSLAGPWVGAAAPGTEIIGLSPQTGNAVNAYPPARPGESDIGFWGTSFAAAYVSGVAALVRARHPELTAREVISRIVETAHNPARGKDNQVGSGLVDPIAALTFDVAASERPAASQARVLSPPAPSAQPDHRGRNAAMAFLATLIGVAAIISVSRRGGSAR